MTRATLPAEKIMQAAIESMKDKERPKGIKHRLEALAGLAKAAHEDSDDGKMEIAADDFGLIRQHYGFKPSDAG